MNDKIKNVIIIGINVCILTVCSWIKIPFVIPITLQTLGVYLICGIYDFKISFTSLIIYIILGLLGLPVFSSFQGGVGIILGPTGGYILSFIFVPLILEFFRKFLNSNEFILLGLSLLLSQIVIYLIGTLWFVFVYLESNNEYTFMSALITTVLPFLIFDIIKMIVSNIVIIRIKKYIR